MSNLESQPYASPGTPGPEESSLSTLGIFYFIIAGLQALFGCLGLLYIGFGLIVAVIGVGSAHEQGDAAAAGVFGGFMACFGVFICGLLGTFALLNFKAGKGLRKRRSLTLCYVMAAIACLNFPLGTILGIFTFIVLGKPGVKESFH
jgi:hypothetical protein